MEEKLEAEMRDWTDGIETRNYGIRCKPEPGTLMDLMRSIVVFSVVAGALLFYSWIRSHIIDTGYEIQNLFAREEALLRTQKALILEEEILRNPERIDRIARDVLEMAPLRPSHLILSRPESAKPGAGNEMAMAAQSTIDE
jgi:cell division protein FtsL